MGIAPMMTLERLPFTRSLPLHWTLLGLGVFVFAITLVAAGHHFVRRQVGAERPEDGLPGRWLLVTIAGLELAFLATVIALVSGGGGLLEGPLTGLKLAFTLPVIATLCAVAAIWFAIRHWRGGLGTRMARLYYSGAVVVALLFTWSLAQWNLLGWKM